jgi:alpha-tubulin suppressor-like RCC1 family protein
MRFDRLWVGKNTSCARQLVSNKLYCWGDHRYGQLYTYDPNPNAIQPFENHIIDFGTVVDVAIGSFRTCAVNTDGQLWCWGVTDASYGNPINNQPRRITLPNVRFTEVATNYGARSLEEPARPDQALFCALSALGNLYCQGQAVHDLTLERGLPDASWHLINSVHLPTLRRLEMGAATACGMDPSGAVVCWGADTFDPSKPEPNSHNAVADVPDPSNPQNGFEDVTALSIKGASTLALKSDGALWAWGDNTFGQLGTGDTNLRGVPTAIQPGTRYSSVALAQASACGVVAEDPNNPGVEPVECWGQPLGQAGAEPSLQPVRIPFDDQVTQEIGKTVVCGSGHCCLYRPNADTFVSCWGLNDFGQLGAPQGQEEPLFRTVGQVREFQNAGTINDLALGARNTCALVNGSSVICIGDNSMEQLGSNEPLPDPQPSNTWVVRTHPGDQGDNFGASANVGMGRNHACALTPNLGVWCWGDNAYRQSEMGLGSQFNYASMYFDRSYAKSLLTLGEHNGCVSDNNPLLRDNRPDNIYCWGDNRFGQTQPASTDDYRNDLNGGPLFSGHHVRGIALGDRHGCLHASGLVHCWGDGGRGRLGQGFNPLWTPTPPP